MKLDLFIRKNEFFNALNTLFGDLNIPVNIIDEKSIAPEEILTKTYKTNNEAFRIMDDVIAFGMVDDAAFSGNTAESLDSVKKSKKDYDGILIFGVTLKKRSNGLLPTRTQLAGITRAFNREYHYTPVVVIFRYEDYISIANAERITYKQEWREGEKAGKVSLLRDIDVKKPHTGHLKILDELKISRSGKKGIKDFTGLYNYWQEVFSVSILNKQFYKELSDWYFWAMREVYFPDAPFQADFGADGLQDPNVREHNAKNLIRLLTRILFVWFIKEKKLIPEKLFDEDYIKTKLLKNFEPQKNTSHNYETQGSMYYRAILQNLFFATLNQDMGKREFRKSGQHRNVTNLMRYKSYFKNPDTFVQLVENVVPFMNGGLFECLDKPVEGAKGIKGGDVIKYIDGFSDRDDNKLMVPDYVFFGTEEHIDLSEDYNQGKRKNRDISVTGLIDILKSYKFTIDENTPVEQDVALDPELLGRVFENLLASYNPETKTTARKQTGSFYTPREIVNYMVDESLIAHLKNKLKGFYDDDKALDDKLHQLLSYDDIQPFEDETIKESILKALDECKILDPACGSGAFPMGALQKMVHIIHKLDPQNERWKERQVEKAHSIDDANIRDNLIKDIEEAFENNELDYGRKLYLIENCIYGVDIQPIAVQISKLRFFISLIVDQKVDKSKENFGVRPLPNLETRFVAANTLVGIDKPKSQLNLFDSGEIKELENKLKDIRHRLFSAKTPKTKRKLREADKALREEIAEKLEKNGMGNETARQLANWDPYDQNASSPFFDPEWMFDIADGFDVVIGNPPYVESRNSALFPDEQKSLFQDHLKKRWGSKGQLIPRGSDLLIYFFEFSLKSLKVNGINTFITQNAWLSTDYGKKFQKFLLKLDIKIKIDESNVKHFCLSDGPNINTVISFFFKKPDENKVHISSVDIISFKQRNKKSNVKIYDFDDDVLNYKWSTLFKSPDYIINLYKKMEAKGSYDGYSIGQGLNITKKCFIPTNITDSFGIDKEYVFPIVTSNDGAPFVIENTFYSIVKNHKNLNKRLFEKSGFNFTEITRRRSMPSLILPRGLGRYFCAYNNCNAYSASFVEVYTSDLKTKENIWIFLNSTIGYLIREITGRSNLGGGMLKAEATDLKSFPLLFDFDKIDKIKSIFGSIDKLESVNTNKLLELPLIKTINNLVYDYFEIGTNERCVIDNYFKTLVERRENKARR